MEEGEIAIHENEPKESIKFINDIEFYKSAQARDKKKKRQNRLSHIQEHMGVLERKFGFYLPDQVIEQAGEVLNNPDDFDCEFYNIPSKRYGDDQLVIVQKYPKEGNLVMVCNSSPDGYYLATAYAATDSMIDSKKNSKHDKWIPTNIASSEPSFAQAA